MLIFYENENVISPTTPTVNKHPSQCSANVVREGHYLKDQLKWIHLLRAFILEGVYIPDSPFIP